MLEKTIGDSRLTSGTVLPNVQVAYVTFGTLNAAGTTRYW